MPKIQIKTQDLTKGVIYIEIEGLLDTYTYIQFKRKIDDLFEEKKYKLIVDMSRVKHLSSAGAGVFIDAISIAQEHKGIIIIIRPNPEAKEIFNLLGVSEVCPIAESIDAALKILAKLKKSI
jgi:anti-sigma B factor antagonist